MRSTPCIGPLAPRAAGPEFAFEQPRFGREPDEDRLGGGSDPGHSALAKSAAVNGACVRA